MNPADARLLVVDDNEDNRYTLGRRLNRLGYSRIDFANDGQAALAAMRDGGFDLVLLDVMMPGMNGYQVLEHVKLDARLRHVPIIMISAVDEVESVIRCIELGAEDYLAKPFNPTLLRARVGASLEKKRLRDEIVDHLARIEQELASAREIQLGMVPHEFPAPPPPARLDVHAALHPAREIGGDLYDFFYRDPRTLCVAIADVAGKGAPAALFMARTKTLLRMVATLLPGAEAAPPHPDDVVARVNRELCGDNPTLIFVTLFLGMLDLQTRRLSYCNAGHNIPYVVARDGGLIALDGARGKPLGIGPDFPYSRVERQLGAGDCLYLFTDGITEATDAQGALFDETRLEPALRAGAGLGARALVDSTIASVRTFVGTTPQSDDIAAMAVRLLE